MICSAVANALSSSQRCCSCRCTSRILFHHQTPAISTVSIFGFKLSSVSAFSSSAFSGVAKRLQLRLETAIQNCLWFICTSSELNDWLRFNHNISFTRFTIFSAAVVSTGAFASIGAELKLGFNTVQL